MNLLQSLWTKHMESSSVRKVAACIVTGSIGFRCSQWSQVNGHAYQSHNPPTDEQTRRDLTDQSRRTSNFQSTEESFSQSPDLPGTETLQSVTVFTLIVVSELCVIVALCLVPTLFSKLIFDLISRAATVIWVSLEIGVHAKLLPLPSQRPTHPEFIPLHLPGVAYQDAG